MVSARPSPRTSIHTFAAKPERNTAACPAELPPPTRIYFLVAAHARFDRRRPVPDAAALEILKLRNRRPAIARAGGDDHAARLDLAARRQVQCEGLLRAIKLVDVARNDHFGTEFLRLDEGAGGERLTGNAGGKAEVILDSRAGAGLAAERPEIEDDGRKPFRAGIDGGRKSGRPGADDRDIEDTVGVIDPRHAETFGNLGFTRIFHAPSRSSRPRAEARPGSARNGRTMPGHPHLPQDRRPGGDSRCG